MADEHLVRVACPLCGTDDSRFERTVAGHALEKCRACRLVFMNPQPAATAIADIYTERDTQYLTAFYNRSATPTVLAGYHEKLADLERRMPGRGRLLDFGCAAGFFTETATARGWEAIGIDLGRWTQAAAASRGFHGIRVGPLDSMGFTPESFDIVNASQVFEHLPDPRTMLAELMRLIRPGGLLAIDVPNYRTLPILANRDDFASNMPPEHLNFFTPRTLRRLLGAGGLQVLRVATEGGLKWENLLGRRVKSEVLDAHAATRKNLGDAAAAIPAPVVTAVAPPLASGLRPWLKRRVLGTLIRPIFYNALGTGMKLYAIGRKVP